MVEWIFFGIFVLVALIIAYIMIVRKKDKTKHQKIEEIDPAWFDELLDKID